MSHKKSIMSHDTARTVLLFPIAISVKSDVTDDVKNDVTDKWCHIEVLRLSASDRFITERWNPKPSIDDVIRWPQKLMMSQLTWCPFSRSVCNSVAATDPWSSTYQVALGLVSLLLHSYVCKCINFDVLHQHYWSQLNVFDSRNVVNITALIAIGEIFSVTEENCFIAQQLNKKKKKRKVNHSAYSKH